MTGEALPRGVVAVGDGFFNVRGSYKLRGLIELGTQTSLVRRGSGRYVWLDAYTLPDDVKAWADGVTDGGAAVEAIVNLHPFHTLHVRAMHAQYPDARLWGTERHAERFGELPWEPERTEDPAFHDRFSEDFDFMVPEGVDFVSPNPNLHFASVLAFHRASRTLHVDDTLLFVRLPKLLRWLKEDDLRFHPSLAKVLERRAGAAAEFRAWARELIARVQDVDNLCAAHSTVWLGRARGEASIAARVEAALGKVEGTLRAHERAHG